VEEFDKSTNNPGLDNLFDGRISLFRQEFSEFCSGLNLEIDLIGEDARNHLREIFVQLNSKLIVNILFPKNRSPVGKRNAVPWGWLTSGAITPAVPQPHKRNNISQGSYPTRQVNKRQL
jgi:hypothetical protein